MTCGALPVVGGRLLSAYGQRRSGQHFGIDIGAREGLPVYAVRDGRVRFVASNGELELYGITVVVDHGDYLSLSAHLQSALVSAGDTVRAGQMLGTVGRTAGTRAHPDALFTRDPPHLHLEFLDAWPVRGGGGGRLDPARIFGELGIVVPESGPLFSACDNTEIRRAASAGGAGLVLVALALFAAQKKGWL